MDEKLLNEKEAVAIALKLFPKLYYFVPPVTPFKERVLTRRVDKVGAQELEIKEPLDAILWLLESLAEDQSDASEICCSRLDLYNLIQRLTGWDQSKFSDELKKLLDAEIIDSYTDSRD